MTLGIAVVAPPLVTVVTDRRVSGATASDDYTKAGSLFYRDAQLAYTLAGLAAVPHLKFVTREWLAEALCVAGEGGAGLDEAMRRLAAACGPIVNIPGVSRADRRLSILVAGFVFRDDAPVPIIYVVSNFQRVDSPPAAQSRTHFEATKLEGEAANGVIYAIGSGMPLITSADIAAITKAASAKPLTLNAVGDTTASVIARVSSADRKGLVGPNATSLVVPNGPGATIQTRYHADRATKTIPLPAAVYAEYGNEGAYVMLSTEYQGEGADAGRTLSVPVVPANHLCPCGSGKKYKRCHRNQDGIAGGLAGVRITTDWKIIAKPEDGSAIDFLSVGSGGAYNPPLRPSSAATTKT